MNLLADLPVTDLADLATADVIPAIAPPPLSDAGLDALLTRITPAIAADAARDDPAGRFPRETFARLHQAGLIAQVVPRAYGGAGATLARASRVIAAVARADAAAALVLTMTYLQHRALSRPDNRWPAPLRRAVYASAVADGALINALRVEPALGSPARGGLPGTVARRDGDGWRLSGHKLYATGIPGLRWLLVWARTDEATPRVGFFLAPHDPDRYPTGNPGIRVIESWDHLGLRASASHEVLFDDLWLPASHAVDIRPEGDWASAASAASQPDIDAHADQQAWMVALLGSLYDALARGARDWLIGFVATRAPASLGAPLSTLSRVQEAIGDIEGWLLANRVALADVVARTDAGAPPAVTDSGLVKRLVTDNAVRVTEAALRLTSNHGLSRTHPLERYYRDALCGRVHTPQDDSIALAAGRAAIAAATA